MVPKHCKFKNVKTRMSIATVCMIEIQECFNSAEQKAIPISGMVGFRLSS